MHTKSNKKSRGYGRWRRIEWTWGNGSLGAPASRHKELEVASTPQGRDEIQALEVHGVDEYIHDFHNLPVAIAKILTDLRLT